MRRYRQALGLACRPLQGARPRGGLGNRSLNGDAACYARQPAAGKGAGGALLDERALSLGSGGELHSDSGAIARERTPRRARFKPVKDLLKGGLCHSTGGHVAVRQPTPGEIAQHLLHGQTEAVSDV